MKSPISGTLVVSLMVGASLGRPTAAVGQERPAETAVAASPGLAAMCAARPESDPFLLQVARARGIENEEAAKAALDALEPGARRTAEAAPDDVSAQYNLAAVLGAGLDFEHGRSKMAGAEKVRDQALRVLELEPEHAGASYMIGRIHASVLRLGGLKRFLATQLFGGGALKGASWEEAQSRLEVAVRGEPCVPDYHFELARVYAERGDTAGAERELADVHALTAGRDGREARLRARAEELGRTL